MTSREEFIALQVMPILGDHADHFDVDGIFEDVATFDPHEGFVWKPGLLRDPDALRAVLTQRDLDNA